ncbi:hypothetical protein [Catenulispora rubra]|uniref:hypothetical protein n=1 Tax=Catenulispora rubra TaxID=280293 RepID=UPI00189279EC|nr:hypothetical protein [Catenulispora rubra]
MSDPLDALETRINQLRRAIRDATATGAAERAAELRAQLRRAERAWDALVDTDDAPDKTHAPQPEPALRMGGSMLPAREHVHRVLMLLGVPAAPKLIVNVHEAFFPGELTAAKLSSLRRDEERSYLAAPGSRPYYLCPALAYDLLSPVRALITISTWTLEQRIIGPLSPRVAYLSSAIRIAEAVQATAGSAETGPSPAALRLLWRFAASIPDAAPTSTTSHERPVDPRQVMEAAGVELQVHIDADRADRTTAARRAHRLTDAQQLFGAALGDAGKLQAEA